MDEKGRGVLVRGGILSNGGADILSANAANVQRFAPPREYEVPGGLPWPDRAPLRLLGVPTPAAEEKRGLTVLTGRVGLVIEKMVVE